MVFPTVCHAPADRRGDRAVRPVTGTTGPASVTGDGLLQRCRILTPLSMAGTQSSNDCLSARASSDQAVVLSVPGRVATRPVPHSPHRHGPPGVRGYPRRIWPRSTAGTITPYKEAMFEQTDTELAPGSWSKATTRNGPASTPCATRSSSSTTPAAYSRCRRGPRPTLAVDRPPDARRGREAGPAGATMFAVRPDAPPLAGPTIRRLLWPGPPILSVDRQYWWAEPRRRQGGMAMSDRGQRRWLVAWASDPKPRRSTAGGLRFE